MDRAEAPSGRGAAARGFAGVQDSTPDRATETYQTLRSLIVRGHLAPGSRVVETDIADRLGVSRTPVRAAIQRLSQEGYIIQDSDGRRSRAAIAPLTHEDSRELFYIVGEIEGLAARWTAELASEPRGAVRDRLASINEAYAERSHSERPDFNELFELDESFHSTYVEAGAGPRLRALHKAIKPQAERYIRVYISVLTAEIKISVREHSTIVEAVRAGDADGAQRAVQANWRNAAQRLSRVIQAVGERGSW